MTDVQQELMTPNEAAKWFRRSVSWLRRQRQLVRLAGAGGQPLYHIGVCRAYVLGQLAGARGAELRRLQIAAMAKACGFAETEAVVVAPNNPAEAALLDMSDDADPGPNPPSEE